LKDNPLTPQLAKIAGPCVDKGDCQKCARDVDPLIKRSNVSKMVRKQSYQEIKKKNKMKVKFVGCLFSVYLLMF
jgi:hypothetical protein